MNPEVFGGYSCNNHACNPGMMDMGPGYYICEGQDCCYNENVQPSWCGGSAEGDSSAEGSANDGPQRNPE